MSRYKKIRKYKKLASRAEALLDAEVAKPAGERDDALADEYALTVLYARERVDELSSVSVKAGTLRYEPRTLPLRKFAAAAAALLLVFCIGASFAQASGVRVWSALVHWDANYLKIDYSPTVDPAGKKPSSVIEYREFSTPEELKAYFGKKLLYPQDEGLEFVAAYAQVTDKKSAIVDIDLMRGTEKITVRGSLCLCDITDDDISVSTLLIGKYTDVYRKAVRGVDCLFAIGEEGCVVSFAADHNVYTVKGGSADNVEEVTASMLG